MNCKRIKKDLIFFAEGTLPEKRKVTVESHLKECNDCRNFLKVLQGTFTFIQNDRMVGPAPFIITRIFEKLETRTVTRPVSAGKLIPAMTAAALFLGAIAGGVMLGRFYSLSRQPNEIILGEEIRFLDEINQEPIESYFINLNYGDYEQE